MQLKSLTLKNFRNFTNRKFEFTFSTVIEGLNGSGKSSVIEAIELISKGESSRSEKDTDMVEFGKEVAFVRGEAVENDYQTVLEAAIQTSNTERAVSGKKFKINGLSKRLYDFAGNLNTILFAPSDLEIVTDGPGVRRRYLDLVLIQTSPIYRKSLSELKKVVRTRNKLLERINKEGRGKEELPFWNDKFLEFSKIVQDLRADFLDFANSKVTRYARKLHSEKGVIQFNYDKSEVNKEKLERNQEIEIRAMMTLSGPMRDDFKILLNDLEIERFGSRGQQRTTILALKMCEFEYTKAKTNGTPLLLLDDIFSELDEPHRKSIQEIIEGHQTIITVTENHPLLLANLKELSYITL